MAEEEAAVASVSMFLYKVELPRFPLILDKDPIREGKLLLPEEFSKEHGDKLSSRVLLKLPDGAEWQVGVVRDGWKTWFHEGWREFAELYSLKLRHLLIFECPTYTNLNVFIFDVTASKIDYPIKGANVQQATLGSPLSSPKTGENPPFKPPQPHKSRRRNIKERTDGASENGGKGKQVEQFEGNRGKRSLPAFQAAKAFTSNQPLFQLIVTRASLSKGQVSIPIAFSERHIKESTRKMELCLGSRFWGVKVVRFKEEKRERMYITGGWLSFARENSLVAGDVCVFELVKSEDDAASDGKMVLNVHVFRG